MILREPELEAKVVALQSAYRGQRGAQHRRPGLVGGQGVDAQHADERHLGRVLRKGRNRSATGERNQKSHARHSMTGRHWRGDGGIGPSVSAVFKTTTGSNPVG